MIYLDNCATTRAFDEAVSASARFQAECYYNASAPYSAALSAEKEMKKAAAVLAASVGLRAEEVFFTSGGTESDNWASSARQLRAARAGSSVRRRASGSL